MNRFLEVAKKVGIVISISLLLILGILLFWLLLIAWIKKVKVYNDVNTDEYKECEYKLVYKTSTKSEGNCIDELFKKENRVWYLSIPQNILDEKVTNLFKIELKKRFCKKYHGEQLIVILENEDETKVQQLGFVIDKEEHDIKFLFEEN